MQAGRLEFQVHVPADDENAAELLSSAEEKQRGRSRSRDLVQDFEDKSLPSTPPSKRSLAIEDVHLGDLQISKNVDGDTDDGDLERGEVGTEMSGNGARARGWLRRIWPWVVRGVVRVSERGAGKGLLLAVVLVAVLTFVLGLFVGLAVGFGST